MPSAPIGKLHEIRRKTKGIWKGVKLWKNWNVCVVMENTTITKVAANVESVTVFVLSSGMEKQKMKQEISWNLMKFDEKRRKLMKNEGRLLQMVVSMVLCDVSKIRHIDKKITWYSLYVDKPSNDGGITRNESSRQRVHPLVRGRCIIWNSKRKPVRVLAALLRVKTDRCFLLQAWCPFFYLHHKIDLR